MAFEKMASYRLSAALVLGKKWELSFAFLNCDMPVLRFQLSFSSLSISAVVV